MLYWPVLLLLMAVGYTTFAMVVWRSLVHTDTAGSVLRAVLVMPAMLCLVLLAQAGFDYLVWPGQEGVPVTLRPGVLLYDGVHYTPIAHTLEGTMYPDHISVTAPGWTEAACTANCNVVWYERGALNANVQGEHLHVANPRFSVLNGTTGEWTSITQNPFEHWRGTISKEGQWFYIHTQNGSNPANPVTQPSVMEGRIQQGLWLTGDSLYTMAWVGIHMGLAAFLLLFVFFEMFALMQNVRRRPAR